MTAPTPLSAYTPAPVASPPVYYRKIDQAPYLKTLSESAAAAAAAQQTQTSSTTLPTTTTTKQPKQRSSGAEADAAAGGGFTRRVSSFSTLLPRVQSHEIFNSNTAAAALDSSSSPAVGAAAAEKRKTASSAKKQGNNNNNEEPSITATTNKEDDATTTIQPDWRLRDRMKTVGVGLVLALNIGTDPPDLTRPNPSAMLECWIDPRSVSRAKAKEIIGERLEQQYAKWQLARTAKPLKYRRALDPTVEDVRALCLQLRRQARNERILLHYNGHGVPRPTSNGEIWVFDKNHTEYIPLSIMDLRQWMGTPSIVVLDCSAAGILIPSFTAPLTTGGGGEADAATSSSSEPPPPNNPSSTTPVAATTSSEWVRDLIVLCPCSGNEWLPMSPDYPADIFTSCLTTPIPIALRWFVRNNATSMSGLHPDTAIDSIPGKPNDRKTPLGELNWIFTAVTDSIAWNMLPKPLFQQLFRQDLLVASMFRNFLLADRILRSLGCTPVSYPPLPPGMADHPLWQAWDLACETLLFQLMQDGVLGNHNVMTMTTSPSPPRQQQQQQPSSAADEGGAGGGGGDEAEGHAAPPQQPVVAPPPSSSSSMSSSNVSSPFFSEQLTAFEVWLDFSAIHKMQLLSSSAGRGKLESPQQLPVVLQVLLSQVHRIRALMLLRRFLQLGPWAINLALSLGIFPYVLKLLQSPEYKSLLVSIWASILSFDPSCRVDLMKDGAFHHFVQHLMWGLNNASVDVAEAAKERTLAAFVLAVACNGYPNGQAECVRLNLHGSCCALLSTYEQGENARDEAVELHLPAHFRLWLVMCLANMVKENTPTQNEAYSAGVHSRLIVRLNDQDARVRAAVCYALGCLIGSPPKGSSRSSSAQELSSQLQNAPPNLGGTTPTLVPQRLAAAPPNMVVAGAIATGPGQLQPTFNPAAAQNIQWRPQQLEPVQGMQGGQPLQAPQLAVPPQPQFLSQPVHLRPPQQAQPMQAQYVMQGQPIQAHHHHHPNLGGPVGFLVGANAVVNPAGQPQLMSPQLQPGAAETRQLAGPSVFEDRRRLELDLAVMEAVLQSTYDASVVVRYEALVALACAVAKYIDAFVLVAEDLSAANSPDAATRKSTFPLPRGMERFVDRFGQVWKALRSLQRQDPFPPISKAANNIVSFVHEQLLRVRMENESQDDQNSEEKRMDNMLAGIDEEFGTGSEKSAPSTPPITKLQSRAQTTGRRKKKSETELRRVLSESVPGSGGPASMEQKALLSSPSSRTAALDTSSADTSLMNYSLPKSQYFEWKKKSFDANFESTDEGYPSDLDPLSPEGACKARRDRRNAIMRENGRKLLSRYASLAPKPPNPKKKSIEMLLEEEDEEALVAAELEANAKKNELELKEKKLLRNEGVTMTSMLRFHPFEDVLVSCATDTVSLWDTDNGRRVVTFENGNPQGSRMTTSSWINEESSSLFFVGCDDGSVRIWGDLIGSNGEVKESSPSLVSAFYALPMKAGERGSGLVCEWQPYSGTMLAGGNSKVIKCWDLAAERQKSAIETNTEANVTTLTTAWDYDLLGTGKLPPGYHGIGQDVVVAGHSDGSLKIFDLRMHHAANELHGGSPPSRRHRPSSYSEHKSWVVATAFTGYSNRYELVSGTLSGEIKAWDLRMSSSIRTLEVQRSTLTALAVHSKIPVAATGSHAQFIKLVTLDGDTIQVLRYHGNTANNRIGPVSCLAFHRFKPLLAAGSTDTFIGLYAPKKPIS